MIFKILTFIYKHPFNSDNRFFGILRFFKWQLNLKLNPYPIIYPYTGNSKLILWKGLTGATGNLYCGLMEFNDMGFLLHFLRPNDLFVDIGANIGAYTILASAEIGANTIAIEPIPGTFNSLNDNIIINKVQNKVNALNIGLGSKKNVLKFTSTFDTINHVATAYDSDTIDVEVNTLDSITNLIPDLIKIDVEGFESEVLKGAVNILSSPKLKAIIIELNGSGKKYGFDDRDIHNMLESFNFKLYNYNPKKRVLNEQNYFKHTTGNSLYIRDFQFVNEKIQNQRKIKILNKFL
jgi:FkbM family methyltransferase